MAAALGFPNSHGYQLEHGNDASDIQQRLFDVVDVQVVHIEQRSSLAAP